MNIEIFVQARMQSTRLPGKVMKTVLGKPLLEYLCERLARVSQASTFRILTSNETTDKEIADFCLQRGIPCFRGSQEHVLERFYQASIQYQPNAIVRITADCPLIDPEVIDDLIDTYISYFPMYDYVSNSLKRTFPRGMDVEIFSCESLKKAFERSTLDAEKEHVTPYIYQHPKQFHCLNVFSRIDLSSYRLTVDTNEDFTLIKLILEHLYPTHPTFSMNDILKLLNDNPDWIKINAHIIQKSL